MEEKSQAGHSTTPISPSTFFPNKSRNSGFQSLVDYEKKDLVSANNCKNAALANSVSIREAPERYFRAWAQTREVQLLTLLNQVYKRRIRILRFVSRFTSLILNGYMVGSESYALSKYFLTKNHIIAGNVHPWASRTILWPTIMLLAISVLTFLMNFITLCTYMCGIGAANKTNSIFSYIGYVQLAAHMTVWAVAVGLFKMANTGRDLWGYSCGAGADAIREQVKSFMDFGKLCTLQVSDRYMNAFGALSTDKEVQTGSWFSSIIEAVTYLLTLVVTISIVRRASHKKKMERVREMEAGYAQQEHGIEMETSYEPGAGRRYMPIVESRHV